ncbi:MAG: hypothetical protein JXM70_06690 [Pirellulales bacterium]|nr:hypothetical protein [Pirellulales bacterium]
MIQYLLPCQCGRKMPVDSTKAGRTLECECGAKIEVPTLGSMKKLERVVETKPASSGMTWGIRQRVLLAGILVCLTGLGISGYFWYERPKPPPLEQNVKQISQNIKNLTLMQTLAVWGALERGLPEYSSRRQQEYQKDKAAYYRRTGVSLFIVAVGLTMMTISIFIPNKHKRSRPPRKNLTP